MENEGIIEIDVLKLIKALWNRVIIIGIISFLCACVGYVYAKFFITPLYKSDILVYVNNNSLSIGDSLDSITNTSLTASRSLVDTYVVILESRSTLSEVARKCDVDDLNYRNISGMISTETVNETEVFKITVSNKDPEVAFKVANTIAEVLPDKIGDIVEGSSARIVDYAEKATMKYYPNNPKYALIGGAIGFVIICAFIIIRELFDDVIKSEDDLNNSFDVPVLAVIPNLEYSTSTHSYDYYAYKKKNIKEE